MFEPSPDLFHMCLINKVSTEFLFKLTEVTKAFT